MNGKQRDFIARSTCGIAFAVLFSVTAFDAQANTNTSLNKNVPNLAGTWQINRKKSDDLRDKLRGTMRGDHVGRRIGSRSSDTAGGLPAGNGIPEGAPQGGLPGENTSGREDMETVRTRMEEEMRAAEVLEIIQTNSEITVNETGSDRLVKTQTFYTDARKSERETARGKLETMARWEGNKFIVVTKGCEGRITRIYELKSGGRELYVTLKIENERMPRAISIRSVYDKS
jgi:hypothetical protein